MPRRAPEEYSSNQLVMMVNHLYRYCSSRNEKILEIARSPKGEVIWKEFHEKRSIDGTIWPHSPSSMKRKYIRFIQYKSHTIEGVIPRKVLFIYKFHGTEFDSKTRISIESSFPQFNIVFKEDNAIRSYESKQDAGDDEEEEEEKDDIDEGSGEETVLHVSRDSDYEDPLREQRMNLSPVLRTPGGTRRIRQPDPNETPWVERFTRHAVLIQEHGDPGEALTATPSTRRVRAPGAVTPASSPDLSPPPNKRAKKQPAAAAAAFPAARRKRGAAAAPQPQRVERIAPQPQRVERIAPQPQREEHKMRRRSQADDDSNPFDNEDFVVPKAKAQKSLAKGGKKKESAAAAAAAAEIRQRAVATATQPQRVESTKCTGSKFGDSFFDDSVFDDDEYFVPPKSKTQKSPANGEKTKKESAAAAARQREKEEERALQLQQRTRKQLNSFLDESNDVEAELQLQEAAARAAAAIKRRPPGRHISANGNAVAGLKEPKPPSPTVRPTAGDDAAVASSSSAQAEHRASSLSTFVKVILRRGADSETVLCKLPSETIVADVPMRVDAVRRTIDGGDCVWTCGGNTLDASSLSVGDLASVYDEKIVELTCSVATRTGEDD